MQIWVVPEQSSPAPVLASLVMGSLSHLLIVQLKTAAVAYYHDRLLAFFIGVNFLFFRSFALCGCVFARTGTSEAVGMYFPTWSLGRENSGEVSPRVHQVLGEVFRYSTAVIRKCHSIRLCVNTGFLTGLCRLQLDFHHAKHNKI